MPEVIDCWFDSGSMPFAQHHYPFENKELFQTAVPGRLYFGGRGSDKGLVLFLLLAISTLIFNKAPYENVIVLGHVQDENGQKMSKSKGNAVDPFDALADLRGGCDPLVFLCEQCALAAQPFPRERRLRKVSESSWERSGIPMRSLYSMPISTRFDATKYQLEYDKLCVMDKWLLSKLNSRL